MIRLKIVSLSITLLVFLLPCRGQQNILAESIPHYTFNHLTEKDGLNAEFIVFALKDSRGYLWLCANPGLYRYDGKVFKHYSFSFYDSSTISANRAAHITEDSEGFLWVSTDNGLNRYDYRTDKFIRFQHNPNDPTSLPASQVNRTILDSKGRIWAGTPNGLSLFNSKTQSFTNWTFGSESSAKPWVWDLAQDKTDNDIIWTVGDLGLYQFRISSQTFTQFSPPQGLTYQKNLLARKPSTSFDRIYEDNHGNLWVTNRYGKLFKFEKKNRQWKSFLLDQSETRGTSSIFPYDNNQLWCGGYYSGIKIFNTHTESVTTIEYDPKNPSSPPRQAFHIFRDNEGIIWCTTNYQVSKLDPYLNYFKYTSLDLDEGIYAAVETYDDILMAMNGVGVIYTLNKATHAVTKLEIPKTFSVESRIVSSCLINNRNTHDLWLGTEGGILIINPKTGKTESFEKRYAIPIQNKILNVNALLQDSFGNVWIGLYYGGLYKYLTHENKLIDLTNIIQIEPNTPKQLRINDLIEDRNGVIWVATNSGLKLLDKKNNLISVTDYVQTGEILNTMILCMEKDKRGNIWLGLKGNGLVEIVLQKSKAIPRRRFGKIDGMCDDMIEEMAFDRFDNLWAVSHNGLIQIDLKKNVINNYNQSDGLMNNNMSAYSLLTSTNGEIYIFKNGGFFTFDVSRFPKKNIPPPVTINSINVLLNDSIRNIYPQSAKSLFLNYDENYISFSFSALNFSKPEENKYQYQLEGLQDYWVKSNYDQNVATYTNLDPGTYTFHVKGSNHDGVWNEQGASFQIKILPPPWKTWWAYTIYMSIIALLSYIIWRRSVTRAHLKTLAAVKDAEAKTLREIDTLKSRFFANISHEFRTPLTLIISPLQKRIDTTIDTEEKKELLTMQRNSSRLLTLVNQLLDLSRAEAGTLKLKCSEADLYNTIAPVASQFASMADSKGIQFQLQTLEPISLFFDRDKLEKIITNLLANAFKFTPTGGTITITLKKEDPSKYFNLGCAEIIITDTGKGIETEHLSKIFDRFYQVDMSTTRRYEGSGIGLSLTKELVELHHGIIEVESAIHKGSTFIVRLPLGKDHLRTEEIAETTPAESILQNEHTITLTEAEQQNLEPSLSTSESILIIEDNVDLRTYLHRELKRSYKIMEATNGEEGVNIALHEIPTLIISDLMMPKKDGLAVCQELKDDERTSHIPIILLTAKTDVESKLSGLSKGADDYIAKPFNLAELQLRIENLISIRKKLQAKFAQQLTVLPSEISVESTDGRFLKKAVELVEAHLADSSFNVEILARELAVSQTQLYRKLQAVIGSGPNEFIRHIRLLRAADLLRQKAGNVSDVAFQVGFNNLSYFAKVFKEKFGVTPIEFLRKPPVKS